MFGLSTLLTQESIFGFWGLISVDSSGNHLMVISGTVVYLGGLPLQYRQLTPIITRSVL
jgi:hypothetical protein